MSTSVHARVCVSRYAHWLAAAVQDDGADAVQSQREGCQKVPVRGGTAASGTTHIKGTTRKFLPFEKALLHARSLKLKTREEWREWCKSGARVANMPSAPHTVYKYDGWQGWGHWLGTGNIASKDQQFLPFKKSIDDSRKVVMTPRDPLTRPCEHGLGAEHLVSQPGTDTILPGRNAFLPFAQALLHARALTLKGQKGWFAWIKSKARPANIPAYPNQVYKYKGWQGYGHWLGTGNIQNGAKRSTCQYNADGLGAEHLASQPGTGAILPRRTAFLPFAKALLLVRALQLKNQKEWHFWCKSGKRPVNIPSCPYKVYKHDGWQGYEHWLGTGNVQKGAKQSTDGSCALTTSRNPLPRPFKQGMTDSDTILPKRNAFLPFAKAVLLVRALKLKNQKEWNFWCTSGTRPANIPSNPNTVYKHDGWHGYGHWLGNSNVPKRAKQYFLPFSKAVAYAQSLNLKNLRDWKKWCINSGSLPANIPSNPCQVYKHEGWQGYGHWLGTRNVHGGGKRSADGDWSDNKDHVAESCQAATPTADLLARAEYFKPKPVNNPRSRSVFLSFAKALVFARSLGLNGVKQWLEWRTSGKRPTNIPSNPNILYKHDGWQGYGHWLGSGKIQNGAKRSTCQYVDLALSKSQTLTSFVRLMFCMVLNI